jgi:hypothetical protein
VTYVNNLFKAEHAAGVVSFIIVLFAGLPDLFLRIEPFDLLPRSLAQPFAVRCRVDEQQIQMVMLRLLVDRQNKAS